MLDDYETYFYTKFIQSLMYNDEIFLSALKGNFDYYIFSEEFLTILEDFMANLIAKNALDNKNRVYEIIAYVRKNAAFNDIDVKKRWYNFFNNLIVMLNQYPYSCSIGYYLFEYTKRCNKRINLQNFDQIKHLVQKSLGYDFLLLVINSDELDEETFDNSVEELINNEYYFASLNAILYEYPELLQNEIFRRRVKKVITLNKKNLSLLLKKDLPTKVYIIKNNFKYSSL